MSAAQMGVWFAQRLDPATPMFNIGQYLDIRGSVDIPRLGFALRQVLAEAETLRARFFEEDGHPLQVIEPVGDWSLPVVDVTSAADPHAAARAWLDQDLATPLDMVHDRLFAAVLLKVDSDRFFLYQRIHHLIVDGYASTLLIKRLAEIYQALEAGAEVPPGEFGSLRELVADDLQYSESEQCRTDGEFWATTFEDQPEATLLSESVAPMDRTFIQHTGRFGPGEAEELRLAARGLRTDWSMLVIASVAAYLHRVTGDQDVVFGLPVTARKSALLRETPAMLSNILPLRLPITPSTTIRELVAATVKAARAALKHQRYRSENVRRDLGVPREEPLHGPTVNILPFDPQMEFGSHDAALHNLSVGPVDDLSVIVQGISAQHGVRVDFAANPLRYDSGELAGHHQRFLRLLRAAVADPDLPIGALDLLDGTERDLVLRDWNETEVPTPDATLPELFAARAAASPGRLAVADDQVSLTFEELDARVERLAQALARRGVGVGRTVAVALPRSAETVVALLAVTRTGAAYLPLDVTYPGERLAYLIGDARPALVLTDRESRPLLPATAPALVLDDPVASDELARPAAPGELTGPRPDDIAYLTYTSGSTGLPKGVAVEHRSLTNLFAGHERTVFAAGKTAAAKDVLRVAHLSGVAFDAAWDPLLWMLAGHELHMVPDQVRRDPEACAQYLADHRIDSIETTPSYVRQLLAVGVLDEPGRYPAVWALGGEAIDPGLWAELCAAPDLLALNFYGPTESTVDSVTATLSSSPRPTIGRPVDNVRAYVLDSGLQPAAVAMTGELYLAGAGLARGYHDRAGLTSERFVADPFGAPGERMYRTGDLVRWTPEGTLDFVGRIDDQVKLRGYRIELGEISAALTAYDDVRQAAVVVQGDLDQRLVAYVVGDSEPAELRGRLALELPDHLIPAAIVVLDELPLTSNGKLDKARLPSVGTVAPVAGRQPATDIERALCAIFAETLDLPEVGVDADFFALGGHSLLATRVVSRIRSRLTTEVSIRTLFEAPTPALLAERLGIAAADDRPVLEPRQRPERIPLSFAQQRLWFLNRLSPESADYNMPMVLRLSGAVDVPALQSALADLVARHESLRTVVGESDGEPYQLILPAEQARPELKIGAVTDLEAQLVAEASRGFDLAAEIPLRARLLRSGADDHVLLIVIHHLAGDGWSLGPFARDLAASYNACLEGSTPDLPALSVQYADYTLWQRELLGAEEDPKSRISTQLDYWTATLEGLPAELALPTDRPRPVVPTGAGGTLAIELPGDLHAALARLAADNSTSVFMTLNAALAALLSKLGAGTDIPIGTPVAGRAERDLDELVGFFVTTLVLRADLTGDPSFRTLLRRVRDADLAAYENQDVPFDRIVEELAPERVPGRNPLFQVMLTLQNNPEPSIELNGLRVEADTAALTGTAKFDLSLDLTEQHDDQGTPVGISGTLEYSADLFDRATAEWISAGFARLLAAVLDAPDAPLRLTGLVTPAERRDLVHGRNGSVRAVPATTLPALFAAQAARTPERSAVVAADGTLTFAGLEERADQLARVLVDHGAGNGDPVAVALPRSADTAVALLAVLKAGAAYLPVDIDYPADRISYLLDDARPTLLITTGEVADRLGTTVPTVLLDDEATLSGRSGDAPQLTGPAPTDLAYLLYTSGSTGRPKGVAVGHSALVNLFHSHAEQVFGPAVEAVGRDVLRVAHTAGVSFDASWDPILWMVAGHELHLVDDATRRDPEALLDYVADRGIDAMETTPSYVRQLVAMGLLGAEGHRPTVIALGGEAVDAQLWRDLAAVPELLAFNFYGPTECAVDSVIARISEYADPVIGTAVDNLRTYVLDAGLQPVPPGVQGELYLAGAGLARGYRGRAGLTAERFVADPYGEPGARMYRTGDLARWNRSGALDFLGRSDDQVKVRGFRVELGEIEAALTAVDGVAAAAVVVHRSDETERLAGYVVPAAGAQPDAAEIRRGLARELPDYMVPASITALAELPLTPNGKLDRSALPEPVAAPKAAPGGTGSRIENRLCELFAATLGVEGVGAEDNFFGLGGHSLLVTRLVSRIRAELGVDIAIRTVFESPTPALLAASWPTHGRATQPLRRRVRPDRIPLSFAQRRMWFLNGLESVGAGYHIPMALELRGELDRDALHNALDDVVSRHESLRTVFPVENGVPHQQILAPEDARPDLPVVTTSRARLTGEMEAAAALPFALDRDLPLRATLFRLADGEHVLLLVVHHIASDGWSTAPLARDLATAYSGHLSRTTPCLSALPVQYADYSLWQQEVLGGESAATSPMRRQLAFWSDALAGLPEELPLPFDHPRPAESGHTGGTVAVDLSEGLHTRLAELAATHGVSLFMALHAGFAALLSRLGGGTDIPIGSPVAGRTDEALDDLVGFFVNTLVLRTDLSGDPTFAELMARVRGGDLAAFDHQDVPFERVVEELSPARTLSRHPLFQVMLTLQNTPTVELGLPGLDVSVVDTGEVAGTKFDLSLALAEHRRLDGSPAGLTGTLEYSADVFERATVERFVRWLARLLESAVADPERPIGDLELLSAGEVEAVLETWNDTARALPPGTVVEAFERQVELASESDLAVVAGQEQAGTAELNAAANQLARSLRHRGIGAGDTVAVAVGRTVRTAVALLGVLKSGASYLPIDLSYPADRIGYLLADAGPSVVLTEASALPGLPQGPEFLVLDDPDVLSDLAGQRTDNLTDAERLRPLSERHPAYVIYTSGSTGRPKGVVVEHRSLANLLQHHRKNIFEPASARHGGQRLRVALTAAVAFDASWDPVLWMIAGHELHIIDDDTRRDAGALVGYLRDNAVDAIETTPSYLRQLMGAGLLADDVRRPRVVALGGEAVDEGLWTELRAVGGLTAYNFYGPTESTVDSVVAGLSDRERPTIGRPVDNTRAYVLDARLRPVPAGVPGELYLSGAGVARGYHNRAPLTAERFVADPFGDGGDRMYRTGDLARWRADATLEFLGRADDQVKLRGFRIEPGEIEAVLTAAPSVAEAAVMIRATASGDPRLVAYVVPATPEAIDPDELRAQLSGTLPDYMIPSAFVALETLPLTPNGKLDQQKLPAPESCLAATNRGPRSPREHLLCRLFATALGVEQVGIDDSFFELGGHSLLASALIGEIRRELGVELPIRRLFETPTVAGLAAQLDGPSGGSDLDVLLPLRVNGSRPPLFCVHPASGLAWTYAGLLKYLEPDQPLYGLQARVLTDSRYRPASIEEIAADYIEQIRAVQPHGPYYLLGWSFGGNLVQTVATHLEAAGEEVRMLALLDAYPHAPDDGMESATESQIFAELLTNQGHVLPEGPMDRARVLEVYREAGNPMGALTEEQLGSMVKSFVTQALLMPSFTPARFDGDVLFFTATGGRGADSPVLGDWRPYLTGTIENHAIDVVHAQLTQPAPMAEIGPIIARRLAQRQALPTDQLEIRTGRQR